MAESNASFIAKTLALVVVIAVATALLTTGIQLLIWKKSNGGVSGGAAAGVAVAYYMSRHSKRQKELADKPPTT